MECEADPEVWFVVDIVSDLLGVPPSGVDVVVAGPLVEG